MAFADEEVRGEHGADLREDLLVVEEGPRAALRVDSRHAIRLHLVALDGGAGEFPRPADAQDAVGLLRGE